MPIYSLSQKKKKEANLRNVLSLVERILLMGTHHCAGVSA